MVEINNKINIDHCPKVGIGAGAKIGAQLGPVWPFGVKSIDVMSAARLSPASVLN